VHRGRGPEHTVVIAASAASGALVNISATATGSREQRNESVQIFDEGTSILVENVDTCVLRPPSRHELVWQPNYSMPDAANMSGVTMGYTGEKFVASNSPLRTMSMSCSKVKPRAS
jgi:hypothetical protein